MDYKEVEIFRDGKPVKVWIRREKIKNGFALVILFALGTILLGWAVVQWMIWLGY